MQIREKWRVPVDLPDSKMTNTVQTGRPFKTRFQEHKRDFKYNNRKSAFAQNLLDNGHSIGKMEYNKVIHIKNKGRMLNTLENSHICKETVAGNQINDKQTSKSNRIFETVLQHDPKNDNTAPVRRTPP